MANSQMVPIDQLGAVLAALADDTRRAMVADVAAHGARTAGELAAPHAISLPSASRHLAVLQRAGLLTRVRHGRHQVFSLNPQPMRDAADWLDRHHRFWTERLDALETYLSTHHNEGDS